MVMAGNVVTGLLSGSMTTASCIFPSEFLAMHLLPWYKVRLMQVNVTISLKAVNNF